MDPDSQRATPWARLIHIAVVPPEPRITMGSAKRIEPREVQLDEAARLVVAVRAKVARGPIVDCDDDLLRAGADGEAQGSGFRFEHELLSMLLEDRLGRRWTPRSRARAGIASVAPVEFGVAVATEPNARRQASAGFTSTYDLTPTSPCYGNQGTTCPTTCEG